MYVVAERKLARHLLLIRPVCCLSECGPQMPAGRSRNKSARADELSTVTYGDSQAQCLLTDCARGPLQRFRDFDHRRLALRVSLEVANMFLRPSDTLNSFGHQIHPV
jgi:hypothetical protein